MDSTKTLAQMRLILLVLFVALGLLAALGWAATGQREMFETPALFFGMTGMILSFGFF